MISNNEDRPLEATNDHHYRSRYATTTTCIMEENQRRIVKSCEKNIAKHKGIDFDFHSVRR